MKELVRERKHLMLILLVLMSQFATVLGQNPYDARIAEREILTPEPAEAPSINGPKIYGVRPGMKFIYRIPCQGERPIRFKVKRLPSGLKLDAEKGIITGRAPEKKGNYLMTLKAKNTHGKDSRPYKLVVGDKIALTPPVGWNTWGGHMLFVSDELMRKAADIFVERGLADVGFQYVSIDDCWMRISREKYESQSENRRKNHAGFTYDEGVIGGERDANGNIVPNDAFPDMKAMTDYIHAYGLKAGLYSTPGLTTCQDFAGSIDHEKQDAEQYAKWGFDLLKYDLCSGGRTLKALREKDPGYKQAEYWKPMADYLQMQDRDILYNLCQYGREEPWEWAAGLGIQTWRTGGDLNHHVENYFQQALRLATELREYSKPGQWNDPDFLYIHKIRDFNNKGGPSVEVPLNTNQRYQYVTLWSIISAPFFFSCDMHEIDDFTIGLLSNADIININQDELGHVAEVIRNEDMAVVMVKKLADGSSVLAVFNNDDQNEAIIQVDWSEFGKCCEQMVYDVWRQKDLGMMKDGLPVRVSPNGVGLFKIQE